MPAITLPTLTRAEVESHKSERSCYVTLGKNVYDVTDFIDSHPGGADLILDYAGQDIEQILKDPDSHPHSEAAYEVLDDSLVGFLASKGPASAPQTNGKATSTSTSTSTATANGNTKAPTNGAAVHPRTGMSCEEDLSKETDYDGDYKAHKFLDLSRPLLAQVWFGGFSKDFYLEQVHRPRHYKGGKSAPLFGNFLEPLSLTPWWVVPTIWLPPVIYAVYFSNAGFDNSLQQAAYWLFGVALWSFIEYGLHRCLFHLDE